MMYVQYNIHAYVMFGVYTYMIIDNNNNRNIQPTFDLILSANDVGTDIVFASSSLDFRRSADKRRKRRSVGFHGDPSIAL